MLGIITASFLIGVGLFQVPAGILAAKHGSRKIAIFGILIASSAALVSGLSGDILHMAILRFLVGIGMACFFGPSVILISRYLEKGSEGLGIGLLNSAQVLESRRLIYSRFYLTNRSLSLELHYLDFKRRPV